MAGISSLDLRTHFEESSLQPLVQTETTLKTPLTHFEKSSLAISQKKLEISPSKPQIPSSFSPSASYQILLVKCLEIIDQLPIAILQSVTDLIKKSANRAKMISSEIFQINNTIRQRQVNSSNWKKTVAVIGTLFFIGAAIPFSTSAILPAALAGFTPVVAGLKTTFTAQRLVNDTYLLRTKAEKNRLERGLQKEIEKQSHLAQSSGNNAFRELEEQVHQLAIALDKQTINF